MTRDRGKQPERVVNNDTTLAKVYFGLANAGVTGQQAIDAVNQMQNEGILFREREPETTRPDVSAVFKRTTHPGGLG